MKYYYYAVLQKEDAYYNVSFPDLLDVNTFGKGIEEAVEMASDALGGHLIVKEDDNDEIPQASDYATLAAHLKADEQLQLVSVETNIIRARENNKIVNKTVTLPNYLVELGKKYNVNFSQMLQRALKDFHSQIEGENEDIIIDILEKLKKINTSELDDDSVQKINNARESIESVWDYIFEINDY